MKIPEPIKTPSGIYYLRLRLGGETVYIRKTTAKACIQEAQMIKAQYKAGKLDKLCSNGMPTYSEAVENYIASKSQLSPATLRGYNLIKNNRFQDVLDVPLNKIDWQREIDKECAKNLSPKTIYNAWGFVKSVIAFADCPVPKKITLPSKVKYDRAWLDIDEIIKLIKAVRDTEYEIPILLAIHSLRRSEICAMTYENCQNGIIKVRGAVVPDETHQFVYRKQNKTLLSSRDIPIMIPRLDELVKGKSGLIYTHSPNTLSNVIKRFCNEAEITEVTAHGLRHSFASLAFSDAVKMSEQEVQELGGWSDSKTIHEIYLHVSQKDRLKHKNKMAKLFESRLPN